MGGLLSTSEGWVTLPGGPAQAWSVAVARQGVTLEQFRIGDEEGDHDRRCRPKVLKLIQVSLDIVVIDLIGDGKAQKQQRHVDGQVSPRSVTGSAWMTLQSRLTQQAGKDQVDGFHL